MINPSLPSKNSINQYSYTVKLACNARQIHMNGNKRTDRDPTVKCHPNSVFEVKWLNHIASDYVMDLY